jgi:lipopolysaccharide/colanic/teichoic acid biosynthesis glycosyltransferase
MSFYVRYGKRCFDLCAACIGIVAVSPVLIGAAAAVAFTSAGPIIFRQERVGKNGTPFRILKFRTMYIGSATDSLLTAAGDPRVTPAGRWLRSSKVDELAQLFNVVKGEMSLVGPRPEVPKYVALYSDEQKRVLRVRPGVTGAAASMLDEELLAGQADTEEFYVKSVLPAKLAIECDYCKSVSLTGDLRLILSTVVKVIRRVGELSRPVVPASQKQV